MLAGRPEEYTEEIAEELCSRIALGNSLRKVTSMDDMPCAKTVYNWFGRHPEFLQQYTRAKEDSSDSRADQIEEIAEKVLTGDYDPQAARVAMDAFKWTSGKHKPKKYGDKVTTEHTGQINVSNLTDEELDIRLRALMNAKPSD